MIVLIKINVVENSGNRSENNLKDIEYKMIMVKELSG